MKSGHLEDTKVKVKVILAAFWTAHFLLWTFGDMVALLKDTVETVADELLLFVAAPLATTQALMILFSLVGKPQVMRPANILVVLVFGVFNLGYLAEADAGWQFLLGTAYLLFNALIIAYAWRWPRHQTAEVATIGNPLAPITQLAQKGA
jgi:hypothetical protein